MSLLGIRREDKNTFERRVPLTPQAVSSLAGHGVRVTVQPSPRRTFLDEEYRAAGATVDESLAACPVILGVKEIPADQLLPGKAYVFFSHTIKGQAQNMPLLRRLLERGCTLIDYEKIVDDQGRRLVFFGRHAGLAGMIDTLWALGQRLRVEGIDTPLATLRPAHRYVSLDEAKDAIAQASRTLRAHLPPSLRPLTFGVTGYGNVALGVQEILELLQPRRIAPADLTAVAEEPEIYCTVFREEHLVEPNGAHRFELRDYYAHPEHYRSIFSRYLERLSVIINCIYWEPRCPRLVTLDDLRRLYGGEKPPRLRAIGDITCDVDGSIEANVRSTASDNPVYVYDVSAGEAREGVVGNGPVILAVDNLPCELPRDASIFFSEALVPFAPALAGADYSAPLESTGLPEALRRATIAHRGELTTTYAYLAKHL
jgi:saccharopine dehydrogenase (NAD+, L-lysine forming)